LAPPSSEVPAPAAPPTPSESVDQLLDETLAQFRSASLYAVLSVDGQANQDDIQAAYHERAKKFHPDRFQSSDISNETKAKAEQVFARINEAYLVLRNPVSRAEYDGKLTKSGRTETKSATAQSAETAEALFREGKALLAKGDVLTAVERLTSCVWICPEKAEYHHSLGVAQAKIPRFRKSAEEHLLKSMELENASADSHLALTRLYIDANLPRKAEQQLKQVLLWDPKNTEALRLAVELKKIR